MDDIRLFETDGDYLVLEAQDGQKYRLLVDDTVRSSVRKESPMLLDTISITPREIQEEIRNGASIDQLVLKSGATFEFIEKFAAPVIAELEHIVSSALSVRLTIAGDRYSDSTQIEFGEIIAGRLVTSGATGISWVAKKLEPNSWHITANYFLNGSAGSATWSFDPRRLTLAPESETAVTLSSQETISNTPIPKLRTVSPEPNAPFGAASVNDETAVIDDVIPFVRSIESETPLAVQPSTPAAFSRKETVEEPLSATADLLEALRRKRTERSSSEDSSLAPHPETASIRIIDFEPEPEATTPKVDTLHADVAETTPAETIEPEAKTPPRKGRAAMPSWDEIVFGTKADD